MKKKPPSRAPRRKAARQTGRAMWKGTLRVAETSIPVKLHAAVEDRDVHFHLVHDADGVRVVQQMVNPKTGEPAEEDRVRKGYEIEPGTFVFVSEEEIHALEPPASRDVTVLAALPNASVEPARYDRPYFLSPDSDAAAYFALARVLAEENVLLVAHWVMRGREHHGVIRAEGDYLLLVTLRPDDEVLRAPRVEPPARLPDSREFAMAEQLISALEGKFDPTAFHDEHRERVQEFVEAKARGHAPKLPAPPRRRAPSSLSTALSQSLARVNRERKSA